MKDESKHRDDLLWIDHLTLWVIVQFEAEQGRPPKQRELYDATQKTGAVNDFIAQNKVPKIFGKPFSGANSLNGAVAKLRRVGLVVAEESYGSTETGRRLVESFGDDWRKWPIRIPIITGGDTCALNLLQSEYMPEL